MARRQLVPLIDMWKVLLPAVSRVGAWRPGSKCDPCGTCKERTLWTEGRLYITWEMFWLTRESQVSYTVLEVMPLQCGLRIGDTRKER